MGWGPVGRGGMSVPQEGLLAILLCLRGAGIRVPGPEVRQQDRLVVPEPLVVFVPGVPLITLAFQQTVRDTKHSAFLKIS